MDIKNIITLAKAGWKASEIKDLSNIKADINDVIELANNGYKLNEVKELLELKLIDPAALPGVSDDIDDKKPDEDKKDDIDDVDIIDAIIKRNEKGD